MTSGSMIRWPERWARAGLIVLACAVAPAWAFDLPELMGLLAQRRSGEAQFTEQRFVRGVDGPLNSSGRLGFVAPDRLERETLSPRPESMRVEGNTVTLSRGGRTRTMTVDSMPELQGMIEAMRATLIGDGAALQRHFQVQLSGTRAQWQIELRPVEDRLTAQLRRVHIGGREDEVRDVEMEFIGGDRSVMRITPAPAGATH